MRRSGRRQFLKAASAGATALFPLRAQPAGSPAWNEPAFASFGTEWITPDAFFFTRHHLGIPRLDPAAFRLRVDGEVSRPLELSLADLQRFPRAAQTCVLECAGNLPGGGMVANAAWEGVRLNDVLQEAGVRPQAVEVILDGLDAGIDESEQVPVRYSRSLPLAKALAPETLLAWSLNGRPLTPQRGFPLRAVVPGWYGMAHVKWLARLQVTATPFTGFYMSKRYFTGHRDSVTGQVSIEPVRRLQVKSQIAQPAPGEIVTGDYTVQGTAWGGDDPITRVEVSVTGGADWREAQLDEQSRPYAWRIWRFPWISPGPGRRRLMVRAVNAAGVGQPVQEPAGRINRYANHWLHQVEVEVVR